MQALLLKHLYMNSTKISSYHPILFLNGPNINMLGIRETNIYGNYTYIQMVEMSKAQAKKHDLELDVKQSNHEGILVDIIQQSLNKISGIIINPGAYSHYSIAILDALLLNKSQIIEVHISNVFNREKFRHTLITKHAATEVIIGQGIQGYINAIDRMACLIS